MNFTNTNLNLYNAFLAVYETRNLRRAAEVLHITRSAVGQKIKELCNQLDTVLFTPTPKGVAPTNAAHNLYPTIKNAMASVVEAETSLKEFNSDSTGIIRISIATLAFSHYLGDYMKEFCVKYPKIVFEFFGADQRKLFKETKLDLVFHIDCIFFNEDFRVVNISSAETAFVATKSFLHQRGLTQDLTKDQLLKLPIIVEHESWMEFLQKNNIATEPFLIKVESAEKAYAIAKNSIGVGFYYKGLLETVNAHDANMVYLNVEGLNMPIFNEFCAFSKNPSLATRAFIDGLIKYKTVK